MGGALDEGLSLLSPPALIVPAQWVLLAVFVRSLVAQPSARDWRTEEGPRVLSFNCCHRNAGRGRVRLLGSVVNSAIPQAGRLTH